MEAEAGRILRPLAATPCGTALQTRDEAPISAPPFPTLPTRSLKACHKWMDRTEPTHHQHRTCNGYCK